MAAADVRLPVRQQRAFLGCFLTLAGIRDPVANCSNRLLELSFGDISERARTVGRRLGVKWSQVQILSA